MGQCMEITVTSRKMHPFLGYLMSFQQNKVKYLKMYLPILGEQNYIQWLKNINKLRCSLEVKNFLYLPKSQKFNHSQNFCSAGQLIELIFDPYFQTLKETILSHRQTRKFFQETFIWYLIYVMTKYVKFNQKKEKFTDHLCFDNVLIFNDGSLKIIPDNIITDLKLLEATTLISQEQIQVVTDIYRQQSHHNDKEKNIPSIYKMGLICLCLIDLKDPLLFYNPHRRQWIPFSPQNKNKILNNCQKRYSSLLIKTIREMLEDNPQKKTSIYSLSNRLQTFQNEIIVKKQLGVGLNLCYSSIDSVKTSHCFDNRTIMANDSQALRTSSINDNNSIIHDTIMEQIEQGYNQKDDNYLSIL